MQLKVADFCWSLAGVKTKTETLQTVEELFASHKRKEKSENRRN
jgi:hypothetical protein